MRPVLQILWRALLGAAIGYSVAECQAHAADISKYDAVIGAAAAKYDVDPQLLRAIIYVESKGEPNTVGPFGEIGLMQVRPEYSPGVSFDPANNIEHGARIISILKTQCKFRQGLEYVVCYNKGPRPVDHDATKTNYYKKVMAAYAQN